MISILLPWRSDDPHRIAAWEYNRERWARLGVEMCVSDDGRTEGPFSLARAVNRARRQATGEILAIYGADHIPADRDRLEWLYARLTRHSWTAVYTATRIFSPAATSRILRGERPITGMDSHYIGMCEGIIALRASTWDAVGGMDERFEGWGAEDVAFKIMLRCLYPDGNPEGVGEVWTLWHPDRHGTEELTAANNARCTEYIEAARAGRMREYLKGVRGDGSGDRH